MYSRDGECTAIAIMTVMVEDSVEIRRDRGDGAEQQEECENATWIHEFHHAL